MLEIGAVFSNGDYSYWFSCSNTVGYGGNGHWSYCWCYGKDKERVGQVIDFIGRAGITGLLFALAMIALMSAVPFVVVIVAISAFLVSLFLAVSQGQGDRPTLSCPRIQLYVTIKLSPFLKCRWSSL